MLLVLVAVGDCCCCCRGLVPCLFGPSPPLHCPILRPFLTGFLEKFYCRATMGYQPPIWYRAVIFIRPPWPPKAYPTSPRGLVRCLSGPSPSLYCPILPPLLTGFLEKFYCHATIGYQPPIWYCAVIFIMPPWPPGAYPTSPRAERPGPVSVWTLSGAALSDSTAVIDRFP